MRKITKIVTRKIAVICMALSIVSLSAGSEVFAEPVYGEGPGVDIQIRLIGSPDRDYEIGTMVPAQLEAVLWIRDQQAGIASVFYSIEADGQGWNYQIPVCGVGEYETSPDPSAGYDNVQYGVLQEWNILEAQGEQIHCMSRTIYVYAQYSATIRLAFTDQMGNLYSYQEDYLVGEPEWEEQPIPEEQEELAEGPEAVMGSEVLPEVPEAAEVPEAEQGSEPLGEPAQEPVQDPENQAPEDLEMGAEPEEPVQEPPEAAEVPEVLEEPVQDPVQEPENLVPEDLEMGVKPEEPMQEPEELPEVPEATEEPRALEEPAQEPQELPEVAETENEPEMPEVPEAEEAPEILEEPVQEPELPEEPAQEPEELPEVPEAKEEPQILDEPVQEPEDLQEEPAQAVEPQVFIEAEVLPEGSDTGMISEVMAEPAAEEAAVPSATGTPENSQAWSSYSGTAAHYYPQQAYSSGSAPSGSSYPASAGRGSYTASAGSITQTGSRPAAADEKESVSSEEKEEAGAVEGSDGDSGKETDMDAKNGAKEDEEADTQGSVYDLSAIEKYNGKYLKEVEDLVIYETNVKKILPESVQVLVSRNGEMMELEKDVDFFFKLTGSSADQKIYKYSIVKNVFREDGAYRIYLFSEDEEGRKNSSESKDAPIWFYIDNVSPLILSVESTEEQETNGVREIRIKDDMQLSDIEIYLGDRKVEFEEDGETYRFPVSEENVDADVKVVARDQAGNTYERVLTNYVKARKAKVRAGMSPVPVVILAAAGALACFYVFRKNQKH